ncbi:acetamidase/formamidase family protein [Altererythrobacter sp. CC-YST694]|uniref:acetamidase/formamidase family protein n=1 Tax=Altererythrobacter sp. CC-YST694 TaxID=2755038 RepID=UPI001D01DFC2|nr:acetamidase/formamidase family protein [Altererythrobacter sp. CC-YST694]MCB5425100.1 acetamidase/formamidase family protein [Altererythrobacter sp. CC-YST694]
MRFTTNAYPKEQRYDAWRFALKRASLALEAADEANLYGELIQFSSDVGIQFVRLVGTAQEYTLDYREEPGSLWLAVLLDGICLARSGTETITFNDGDMICGRGETPVSLQFTSDHRMLLLKIPAKSLDQRLKAPLPEQPRRLSSDGGPGRVLSSMLRSVADMTTSDVPDEGLRPVELALPEFLLAALLSDAPPRALGGAAGMRAALLERIFQTIEMRLSDPNLNYQQVASEHGISPRYLQKLFESIDDSFGHYVKVRRLERCRLDLRSPLHTQKSISDILFQWGFNDSASFSRAFREQYGVSPREYRKSGFPEDVDPNDTLRRGRPARRTTSDDAALAEAFPEANETVGIPTSLLPIGDDGTVRHHHLPVSPNTVHWGYFSSLLKPVLSVRSGDFVTVETLTHHANDDPERMVEGDEGAESVFHWDEHGKAVERRGAGPMDASEVGRGAGEGFGVHICTGPIAIQGAEPGDIIEVRILSLEPRRSCNPRFQGKAFGSNAATFWGFQYNDLLSQPNPREVVTIYEVESGKERVPTAHAVYSFRWTPQTDPSGIVHDRYDYPGVPVDPDTIERNYDILRDVEIPVRPHFGVIAVAPAHTGPVDSIPPSSFGGNMDNWRTGPGSSVFLPVQVSGGLLSLGDPHASQGDSELCGTAIECSMTALIQVIRHAKGDLSGMMRDLDYPLIETESEWVIMGFSHPDYLKELGEDAQSEVYKRASIDSAMRDAFRKARRFLMTTKNLSEDEAISLISVAVDFGISQVANGNWGVHAIIRKGLFTA